MLVDLLYWQTVGSWISSCLLLSALLKRDVIAALCTIHTLKDPWRAHYISLHYSHSQRSMTRSLYLSALLNLSKIHDALTISLPFSTSQSLHIDDALTISLCTIQDSETIKSMTRTIYLLENIKTAFRRFSQSLQIYDVLNISLAEHHYSCILKALSKLSSPWHPQYFCCSTTL